MAEIVHGNILASAVIKASVVAANSRNARQTSYHNADFETMCSTSFPLIPIVVSK